MVPTAPPPSPRPQPPPAAPSRAASGHAQRPSRGPLLAIGAVAVAVVAAVVIVVANPFARPGRVAPPPAASATAAGTSAPPSPDPSSPASAPSSAGSSSPPTTEQAATNLALLLAQSANDRQAVNNAYNDAVACGANLSQDARAFAAAASSHRALLQSLARLPGQSELSQPMLSDLKSAWQASVRADDDYARWARGEESGCSGGNQSDSSFVAATAPNLRATASKSAFIQLWNPLAESYGLTTYAQDNF